MHALRLAAVGLVVGFSFASTRADEAEARAIIEKAVKAAGGVDALEKTWNATWKMQGNYHGGGEAMPYTATYALAAPNKYRMEVQNVFTVVVNDDQGWIRSGGTTQEMNEEQLKEQREQQFSDLIASLVPLVKQKDQFKLTTIDGEKVNERKTLGVEVESEERRDVKLFFDAETYDLLKVEYDVRSAEQGFEEVEQEIIFKNYKEVDGVKVPTEMLMLRDGEKYVEGTISDYELVEQFDEGVFAKP